MKKYVKPLVVNRGYEKNIIPLGAAAIAEIAAGFAAGVSAAMLAGGSSRDVYTGAQKRLKVESNVSFY